MKRVAIVQARMSSSRFPGKVLQTLDGVPMILYMLHRVSKAAEIDQILVATSMETSDDVLERVVVEGGFSCYRGDLVDVLSRFASAANHVAAEIVVRLTGDCPLIDCDIIDRCVSTLVTGSYDYVSNVDPPTYPDGLDVEAFSARALSIAHAKAELPSDREHVTPFIRRNKTLFRQQNIESFLDLSHLRWTVDHPDDLELVRAMVKKTGGSTADRFDLLRAIDQNRSNMPQNLHPRNEKQRNGDEESQRTSARPERL